jgi:hypothetical protein
LGQFDESNLFLFSFRHCYNGDDENDLISTDFKYCLLATLFVLSLLCYFVRRSLEYSGISSVFRCRLSPHVLLSYWNCPIWIN